MPQGVEVELRSVCKQYGRAAPAVDDLPMHVPGGRFVTLLGPSGSGKTTTLMMIAGFVAADRGDIRIGGRSVVKVPPNKRAIGVVFQHYALFPHKTVFQNIAYPLRARRVGAAEIGRRVRESLERIRLPDVGARYPRQLSGGQQQRVALARALVFEPSVLLMDEPLGALDRKLREQMQIELRTLQRALGITTISVTHDQEEALALSDLVVVLRDGRIEQQGAPNELYEGPKTAFIADFLGAANLIEGELSSPSTFRSRLGAEFRLDTAPNRSGPARLMIRPERVRWAEEEPTDCTLDARVGAVVYLGPQVRYHLTLADGQELVATRPNRPGTRQHEAGEPVRVGWRLDDVVLL